MLNEQKGYRQTLITATIVFLGLYYAVIVGALLKDGLQFSPYKSSYTQVKKPLPQLNLDPKLGVLIEDLVDEAPLLGLERRGNQDLLTEVADSTELEDVEGSEPFALPWFYYSPAIEKDSPSSYANRYPLIKKESLNGFSWHEGELGPLLMQNKQAYTGFFSEKGEGWKYYEDGYLTNYEIPQEEVDRFVKKYEAFDRLFQKPREPLFFQVSKDEYAFPVTTKNTDYSILYRDTHSLVFTSPPGTQDSRLLTTTENFYEMPLEVMEEATLFGQTWLHVYIGYEPLGWIEKDNTRTKYVPTYYSERELLDAIQWVMEEEISNMNAVVGASFVNNETMSQVSVNDWSFFPASTQKIYVLGEVYHQYKTGELDPYASYMTLYDEDRVEGAGIIQGYPTASTFSIDELVDLVVWYSDNTAANLLIDAVGGGYVINPHVQQLGFTNTFVSGKYYGGEDTWFRTTPSDAARFFAMLDNDQINGVPWDEELILKFLKNSHTFLRAYISSDVISWNKSGLGSTEQNDVATFVTPYGRYSLAVFTSDPASREAIAEQMGYLSVRVLETFNEIRSDLWISVDE